MAMNADEAVKILEALARGIDPETGQGVAEGSLLHNPHVVRALFMGARALERCEEPPPKAGPTTQARAAGEEAVGQRWTPDEERRLLEAFDAGCDVAQRAKAHQRKPGGIRARLVRLGRLGDEDPSGGGAGAE